MESLSYHLSRMTLNCLCGGCDCKGAMCPFVWSNLPHDLIIQLLFSRLPQKVPEFRCLSKAFNFSISEVFIPKLAASAPLSGFVFKWETFFNPEYYWKHRRRIKPPNPFVSEWFYGYVSCGGSFDSSEREFVDSFLASLPFIPQKDDFWGCFNGFLLVCNSSNIPVQYYVSNPATRQSIAVLVNPTHLAGDVFVGLAFDPLDPLPHSFKIVRVARCPEISSIDHPPEFDVFSSVTGKWVNYPVSVENTVEILGYKWISRSVYARGMFYMLSTSNYLVCFDLGDIARRYQKLTPRAIKLPHTSENDCLGLFEVSNGCFYYAGEFKSKLLVWTYQVSNEACPWELKYSIHIRGPSRPPFYDTNPSPLDDHFIMNRCFVFAVDLCNEVIYLGSKYLAFSYNIKTDQIREICGMREISFISVQRCFYAYSPSLVKFSQQLSPTDTFIANYSGKFVTLSDPWLVS